MATFILVHGSWHGGWSFDLLAARLAAAGHSVDAPTLPGMGGSEEELRAVTLDGWTDFIVARCRAARERGQGPVVLAGHSRGGIVITAAAERDPEAMDALVYICAHMLPSGLSRADFAAQSPRNAAFAAIVSPTPGGAGTVVDPEGAHAVFAQLSPPEVTESAAARLLAEPNAPRDTPVFTTPERWGKLPRTYVECTEDRVIPIADQRRQQALSPGARVVTLEADHSPFFSRPDELAAALISAIP
ncbi:alpha/beta fold hydrolase [Novosphingobium flavum]|uniref:Alpha/beta fold hydrolase n=1 Tax=Novosphingobium flavum TaxID=1778672 RepID=A0A7X1FU06_9SPHN|nr:alpha/beta fold hydrolase [Novosphingobium flavum]MBC2666953.1 alpha/beta fold hydrolase [Novosphingobium flavum]